jgi:hypothetical protein
MSNVYTAEDKELTDIFHFFKIIVVRVKIEEVFASFVEPSRS